MIIDSHSHAWPCWPYQPPVPDDASRGAVEQLLWEMDQHGVDRAVLVCARIDRNEDNNDYVARAVARYPGRLVQFADVDCKWSPEYHTPGAARRLTALADRLPIKGVTHYVKPENDGWFGSEEGMAFFRAAAERKLILSLAAAPPWQEDIRRVARAFPSLPILCHHLAGLRAGSASLADDLDMVLASGALPNVMIKISGFYYGSDRPWDYPHAGAQQIVKALYETFGPRRLCWGSDYPVVRRALTYRQALEIVRDHCQFIAPDDRDWILGGTLDARERLARTGDFQFEPFNEPASWYEPPPPNPEAEDRMRAFVRDLDILMISRGAPRLTGPVLDAGLRLKFIGELEGDRFAQRIDMAGAAERGMKVVDTTHGSSYPVSEWALGLMLIGLRNAGALFRRMIAGEELYTSREQRLDDPGYLNGELTGKRVGFIACGHIGRRLLELLRPFRVEVLVYDPQVPRLLADIYDVTLTSLDRVMAGADVVVCLAPLTDKTRGMIGADELDLLKPGAVFVNVSRGAVVDTAALISRLHRRDIVACLDVFDPERPTLRRAHARRDRSMAGWPRDPP